MKSTENRSLENQSNPENQKIQIFENQTKILKNQNLNLEKQQKPKESEVSQYPLGKPKIIDYSLTSDRFQIIKPC